jgi:fatty acid desaturase
MSKTATTALRRVAPWRRWELPTWGVAAAIYGGFGLVTWMHQALPWWLVSAIGAWLVCWHGSLQHEILHGHPTGRAWLNAALAAPPLGLWLPYPIYRDWHLAHHRAEVLASPLDDPESYYLSGDDWRRAGRLHRALLLARNTLAGRLLLGPPWMLAGFLAAETRRLRRGDLSHLGAWLVHLALVAALVAWLQVVGLPLWFYVLGMLWPGLSLTLLRSFHEHRPAARLEDSSLTLDAARPLALLYLNNNLHAAHHAAPGLAWYELPRFQRQVGPGGDYAMPGYARLFRRYLFHPRDLPVYPN